LSDCGKRSSNLLKKKFPANFLKFTSSTKPSAKGISLDTLFLSNIRTGDDKEANESPQHTASLDVGMEIEEFNANLVGTLTTDNFGKLDVTISDLAGLGGSQVNWSIEQVTTNVKQSLVSETEFTYRHKKLAALRFGALYDFHSSPQWKGALSLQKPDDVYWSIRGAHQTSKKNEEENYVDCSAAFKVAYVAKKYEAHLGVTIEQSEIKTKNHEEISSVTYETAWFQQLTDRLNYAIDFAISVNDKGNSSVARVGAEYKLDCCSTVRSKSTTLFEDKNKVTPRFAFGLTQSVSNNCLITVGADLNAIELFGHKGGKPHSLGFEINIS